MAISLKQKFEFIHSIKQFFDQQQFLEFITPPLVENPGMETHIHPFQAYSAVNKKQLPLYLHTSPEFFMKEALATDHSLQNIYSLAFSFRDEPESPIHRPQFLMLEWYRKNAHYDVILNDTTKLFNHMGIKSQLQVATVQELFLDYINIDILNFLDTRELRMLIEKDFKDVPLPSSPLDWDDLFFLLFLNKIEIHFRDIPLLCVKEYPAPLAALSTLKPADPRVCERFEIYSKGVELCNCFNEVTDFTVLESRFSQQANDKKRLYHYELNWPKRFLNMIQMGYPKSSGNALGVERLMSACLDQEAPFWD